MKPLLKPRDFFQLTQMSVSPSNDSVAKGLSSQYTATGTYTDASASDITTTATWSSTNTAIASISNSAATEGLATGPVYGAADLNGDGDMLDSGEILQVMDLPMNLLLFSIKMELLKIIIACFALLGSVK